MHTVRTSTSTRSRRLAVTALLAGAAEGGPVSKAQIERQEILQLEEQRRLAQLAEHYGLSKPGSSTGGASRRRAGRHRLAEHIHVAGRRRHARRRPRHVRDGRRRRGRWRAGRPARARAPTRGLSARAPTTRPGPRGSGLVVRTSPARQCRDHPRRRQWLRDQGPQAVPTPWYLTAEQVPR